MTKQKTIAYFGILLAGVIIALTVQYVVGVAVTITGSVDMNDNQINNLQDGSLNSDAATVSQAGSGTSVWSEGVGYIYYNSGKVGIGTTDPGSDALRVEGGPINAWDGLVIEKRDDVSGNPVGAEVGRIWICVDAGNDCQ